MRKELRAYYVSRTIISFGFSVFVMGFTLKALIFSVLLTAGFILYAHSGWFVIDFTHPLFPLRRDPHAKEIQRKALSMAISLGVLLYMVLELLHDRDLLPELPEALPLMIGISSYLAAQFFFFLRSSLKE